LEEVVEAEMSLGGVVVGGRILGVGVDDGVGWLVEESWGSDVDRMPIREMGWLDCILGPGNVEMEVLTLGMVAKRILEQHIGVVVEAFGLVSDVVDVAIVASMDFGSLELYQAMALEVRVQSTLDTFLWRGWYAVIEDLKLVVGYREH
jgi:hypothetical protein